MFALSSIASKELTMMRIENTMRNQWKLYWSATDSDEHDSGDKVWSEIEQRRIWLAKQAWRAARDLQNGKINKCDVANVRLLLSDNPFFEQALQWRSQGVAAQTFALFALTVLNLSHKSQRNVYRCGLRVERIYGVAHVYTSLPPRVYAVERPSKKRTRESPPQEPPKRLSAPPLMNIDVLCGAQ